MAFVLFCRAFGENGTAIRRPRAPYGDDDGIRCKPGGRRARFSIPLYNDANLR